MSGEHAWIGAVLAGGASRRMGRPKHAVIWTDGQTLGDRVVAALESAGAREVVIVGSGPGVESGWSSPRGVGRRRVVADRRPGQGPLAGIESLLGTGLARRYLVCPCDMPTLRREHLRRMIEASDAALAVPATSDGSQRQPLPMRIDGELLPVVTRLLDRGERSLLRLLEEAGAAQVEGIDGSALVDIDTAADLVRHSASEGRTPGVGSSRP